MHSQICVVQLLVANGLAEKCSFGRYALLPLCQRALDKLCLLVDKQMQAIGAAKLTLPTLIPTELWKKTG